MDLVNLQRSVAINRDEKALEAIFLFFYHTIIKLIFSITKSKEAAEEIYSDLMFNLWNLGVNLLSIVNLKVYLYKSAHNASLNYIRGLKRKQSIAFNDLGNGFSAFNDVEDYIIDKELKKLAEDAILQLPPKCQMVFKLVRDEGLTYKETAEVLNISVNTVENHMVTALSKLQELLKLKIAKKKRFN